MVPAVLGAAEFMSSGMSVRAAVMMIGGRRMPSRNPLVRTAARNSRRATRKVLNTGNLPLRGRVSQIGAIDVLISARLNQVDEDILQIHPLELDAPNGHQPHDLRHD